MLSLHEVATMTRGRIVNAPGDSALRVDDVTTDSRQLREGALFVALSGDRFDGHDYVDAVAARGAVAALVERMVSPALPLVVVDDTRHALGDLASGWRRRFRMPLIVVTGSNGKTTTKEMIAAILSAAFGEADFCATAGNFNNDIGVPLTLLRLRTHHHAAAIELGMNHPGETARLAYIAGPDVALVLNAQREHQEFMQTVEAVADEHALAIEALGPGGTAIFPADDAYAHVWRTAAGSRRVVDFACTTDHDATSPAASVVARTHLQSGESIVHLDTPAGTTTIHLHAAGMHNVRNAAAAAAACIAAGIGLDAVRRGLEAFRPVGGRSQVGRIDGATLIDDTYNANPDSMRAAIEVLASHPSPRLLVVGDMGEVGDAGPRFHREIGDHASTLGVETLHAFGAASRDVVAAFGVGARHFDDIDALIAATRAWVADHADATVLVKGSRFMKMERVVAALRNEVLKDGH